MVQVVLGDLWFEAVLRGRNCEETLGQLRDLFAKFGHTNWKNNLK